MHEYTVDHGVKFGISEAVKALKRLKHARLNLKEAIPLACKL
jgi:hypothetical protein